MSSGRRRFLERKREKGTRIYQRRADHGRRTSARWLAWSCSVTDETRERGKRKERERNQEKDVLKGPSHAGKERESTTVLPRRAGSLYTKRELYYDARGSEKGEA